MGATMLYMALPVSFRWDDELVWRVDEARGDVPRSVWVRRAVERALDERGTPTPVAPGSAVGEPASSPAPAEQPEGLSLEKIQERIMDAAMIRPAREFRPYPKGGKR